VIVHSTAAEVAVRAVLPKAQVKLLPHPILEPIAQVQRPPRAVVRVLGQYKADRDIAAMRDVAAKLPSHDFAVTGRGWPAVPGWTVDDRFVPEEELDKLISTASAVMIPYTRFYQSGIAVRCLERGVPAIGPANTSLSDLFSGEPALLVDTAEGDWTPALAAALTMSPSRLFAVATATRRKVVDAWCTNWD
jgi:hypothetical protein